jgi:hypothetical protein
MTKRARVEPTSVLEEPAHEPSVDVPMDTPEDVGMPPVRLRVTGKHPPPPDAEDPASKRARLVEVLMAEPGMEEEPHFVQVEDPALWWPWEDVHKGDCKEFLYLGDRNALEERTWDSVPATAQVIPSRVLRKPKGEGIKSRLVLQDFKQKWKVEGGEVYAATASQGMVRFALAIGSVFLARDPSYEAVILDGTQAFTHADMEDEVYTRLPPEVDGLEVALSNGKVWKVNTSQPHLASRALYGYR